MLSSSKWRFSDRMQDLMCAESCTACWLFSKAVSDRIPDSISSSFCLFPLNVQHWTFNFCSLPGSRMLVWFAVRPLATRVFSHRRFGLFSADGIDVWTIWIFCFFWIRRNMLFLRYQIFLSAENIEMLLLSMRLKGCRMKIHSWSMHSPLCFHWYAWFPSVELK